MKTIQPLENGKYYHIYNRGINSDILFKEYSNYDYFLKLYDKHVEPIAETYAWCLMKNHFHFLVRIKDTDEINREIKVQPSQIFSNLFNAYTKAFNKSYNRHGALFERPSKEKKSMIMHICKMLFYTSTTILLIILYVNIRYYIPGAHI